jgi:hypothetical protein
MTNRKLITIPFLIGCIGIYSLVWYFVSQNINGCLTKHMEIAQEKIKLSGYPFNIKFKIKDASIERVSYNLLSKKLSLNLKKEAFDSLVNGKADAILKHIEYINFSSTLDSYFVLMQIIQNKGTKFDLIDAFNLFTNIGVSLKANIKDQTLDAVAQITGTWDLSLPNKRIYANYEDILSDLPRNMSFEGSYQEDMIINDDRVSFLQKISKLSYPAKSQLKGKISLSDHVDARDMDETKLTELIRKLNFDLRLVGDSKLANEEVKIMMSPGANTHNVNIDHLLAYKDEALQNFFTIFNSEDISEMIENTLYNYNVQLNDNSKLKFKLFGDLMLKKMQVEVQSNPNYWKKFASKISMSLPYKEGFGGLTYLLDLADNKTSSLVKIVGSMSGSGTPDGTKGSLLLNNTSHTISEIIEVLRLIYFATSRTMTSDNFKLALESFDKDVKTIDDTLLSLSDHPNEVSGNMLYSYDISKKEMMNSKFSNSGKTLIDLLVAFAPLFSVTEETGKP